MSQHVFRTTLNGQKIEVLAGWDRPLRGYFLVIGLIGHKDMIDEPYLFSNLDIPESHPKSFDYFREVLEEIGICVPQEMIEEIIRDGAVNKGNKRVRHEITDGNYSRNVLFEEAP